MATSFDDARVALTERYGEPRGNEDAGRGGKSKTLLWSFKQSGKISVVESPGRPVSVFFTVPIFDDANNY